jgi:hypothetical protein
MNLLFGQSFGRNLHVNEYIRQRSWIFLLFKFDFYMHWRNFISTYWNQHLQVLKNFHSFYTLQFNLIIIINVQHAKRGNQTTHHNVHGFPS